MIGHFVICVVVAISATGCRDEAADARRLPRPGFLPRRAVARLESAGRALRIALDVKPILTGRFGLRSPGPTELRLPMALERIAIHGASWRGRDLLSPGQDALRSMNEA